MVLRRLPLCVMFLIRKKLLSTTRGVFYDTTLICFSDPTNPSCKGSRFSPITYSTVLKKRNIPPLCGGLDWDQELTKAAVRGNESGEMYVIELGFIGFIDL